MEEPEPVQLRSAGWAKWCFLSAVCAAPLIMVYALATAPESDVRDHLVPYQAVAGGLVLLAVIVWSWISVDNARRLLAHSRFAASVSPWRATFWWLAPSLVGVPALIGLLWLGHNVIEPAMEASGDGDAVVAFLVVVWVVIELALWARPYLYLAYVASRIHADSVVMRRWLWVPVAASLGAMLGTLVLGFVGIGRSDVTLMVYSMIVLGLSLLPYVTWCWLGWNALSSMDLIAVGASAAQRRRRDEYLQVERRAAVSDAAFDPAVDWR